MCLCVYDLIEVDGSNSSKDKNWSPIHSMFFKIRSLTAKCMFLNAISNVW